MRWKSAKNLIVVRATRESRKMFPMNVARMIVVRRKYINNRRLKKGALSPFFNAKK